MDKIEDVLEIKQSDKTKAKAGEFDIGTTLVVENKTFTKSTFELVTLEAISEKKRLQTVVLSSGRKLQFWPDGYFYSQEDRFGKTLLWATDKLVAYIIRQNRIQFMKDMLWENIPTSQVEAVLRILVTPEAYEEEELLHWLPILGL